MNKTLTTAFIVSSFFMSSAFAALTDYDGKWNGKIKCTAFSGTKAPGFTANYPFNIQNGRFAAKYPVKDADGKQNNHNWDGVIDNGSVRNLIDTVSREGAEPWTYVFSGNAVSKERITAAGVMNFKGEKRRDCELEFTLLEPAPNSLAAKSLGTTSAAADVAKSQAEVAKAKADADKAQAEAAKARAEATKAEAEAEKAKAEAAQANEQAKAAAESRANAKSKAAAEAKRAAVVHSTDRTSPPPNPVAASQSTPARAAAIGNVAEPANSPKSAEKFHKITSNPIDTQKKLSSNEVWISFNPSITVQERQFCRIIENFRVENAAAGTTKNQIKINETFRNLAQSLNALLPDGKFQGWIIRMVNVSQASDGSAEVLLELPCNVYVGSNACDANPKNFYGTAPEGSRIYSEFAKMTVGDFALTSGQFLYADEKAFDKGRSVASFRYMRTAAHCKAKAIGTDSEFFGLKVDVISTIK